jgi:uncharacterized protein
MPAGSTREVLRVRGMTCGACEKRIEKAVSALDGVQSVRASAPLGEVDVRWDPGRASRAGVAAAIRGAGYEVLEGAASRVTAATAALRLLGLFAVAAALFMVFRSVVGARFLPAVTQSMGYGMILVAGLLTSLHCIAMCGGIVLSQGMPRASAGSAAEPAAEPGARLTLRDRLGPSLRYNLGRVISYTLIGGLAGALGSLFSLSTALKGAIPVAAGAFMLFLGVRMTGLLPRLSRVRLRLPGVGERTRAAAARRGPFVVGLLNGLMPCGPLQTMQVYALGTRSALAGAFSMLLFSLGTVPLLLGFGAVSSLLGARFNRTLLRASGALVVALGLVMLSRGMSLFGVGLPVLPGAGAATAALNGSSPAAAESRASAIPAGRAAGGRQEVRTSLAGGQYRPIVVRQGIPVRWTISAGPDDLNGCDNPLTIPSYGIRKVLAPGDNVIEFTPDRTGTIAYTCWMGMISSTITVVSDAADVPAAQAEAAPGAAPPDAPRAPGPACACCAGR